MTKTNHISYPISTINTTNLTNQFDTHTIQAHHHTNSSRIYRRMCTRRNSGCKLIESALNTIFNKNP